MSSSISRVALGVAGVIGLLRAIGGVSQQETAENSTQNPSAKMTAELHLPEAAINRYFDDQKKQRRLEGLKLFVETLVLLAATGAGIFAYLNWDALKESNRISNNVFTTSQRAYVTVNGLDVQPVANSEGFWRATPIFTNSGNTSTKNLWWTSVLGDTRGIKVGPFIFNGVKVGPIITSGPAGPKVQTFKDLQAATRNRFTLSPRQEARPLELSTPLPADYIRGLIAGTAQVYVHGVVFYEDFFTTKGHVTRYCFSLWHNPAITGPGISYSSCGGVYTCSDEECEDYENLKTLVGPEAGGLPK
jgi:hypothetical protein